ncbi:hypothetical protein COLO4_13422 [Corchorus olitorius]|uniref:Uncharacterized protein n=1 Tax=Corchorus olitorius TaxID=93759 RepID=A0A1R3JWM3_9ROSI|nr:hypothetical protein COLO4_13422 [Corchorus olitorius]
MGSMGREMESDELAVVKAAAWAWYQHGSGKPMREFDVTTRLEYSDSASASTSTSTRPSRYKLEAMRNSIMSPTINSNESDSLLLDPYEIQSISKRLFEFSGIKVYDESMQMQDQQEQDHIIGTDHDEYDYQKKNQNNMSSAMGGGSGSRKKKKKSKYRQFLKAFLPRHAVVCGRSQDVDDRSISPIFRLRPQN